MFTITSKSGVKIKGLNSSILKNEKNISEHDYTCIHVSYKDNCSNL